MKETYSALYEKVQQTHHFPQTVHCCSSSHQPLSETLGFSTCLFKPHPPDTAQSALIGQLVHSHSNVFSEGMRGKKNGISRICLL